MYMSSEVTPKKHKIKDDSCSDSDSSDSDIEDRIKSIKKRFNKKNFIKKSFNKPHSYYGQYYAPQFAPFYKQYHSTFKYPHSFSSDCSDSDSDSDSKKCTNKKYNKDPKHYLNKALYFYYNQNPNFDTKLKPCAYPRKENFLTIKKRKYYDPVSQKYYEVCEKINDKDSPIRIKKTYYKIRKPKHNKEKNDSESSSDDKSNNVIKKSHGYKKK